MCRKEPVGKVALNSIGIDLSSAQIRSCLDGAGGEGAYEDWDRMRQRFAVLLFPVELSMTPPLEEANGKLLYWYRRRQLPHRSGKPPCSGIQ